MNTNIVYNKHRNNHDAKQCWTIRHLLNLLVKVQIESYEIIREGGSLFHLIDEELNLFLWYLMQWVIGGCNQ